MDDTTRLNNESNRQCYSPVTLDELKLGMEKQFKMSAAQEALSLCNSLWTEAMNTKDSFNSEEPDLEAFINDAEKTILNPEDKYNAPDSFLNDDKCPVFVRSDFSILEGKAKSRKTFLSTLLVSFLLKGKRLSNDRFETPTECKCILWVDTEMGMQRTARILDRLRLLGVTESEMKKITHLSMRELGTVGRFKTLLYFIALYRPDFVLVDGIADLMNDVNSIPESVLIRQLLLTASSRYGCHLCAVLHVNEKGTETTARGHIGSELTRKCATVIHLESKGDFSEITYSRTRDKRPDPFYLQITEVKDKKNYNHAIPILVEAGTPPPKTSDNVHKDCQALHDYCRSKLCGVRYSELLTFLEKERKVETSSTRENRIAKAVKSGYIEKNASTGLYYPKD